MRLLRLLKPVAAVAALAGVGAAGYETRGRWLPAVFPAESVEPHDDHDDPSHAAAGPSESVTLTAQAQANLRLTSKPLKAGAFWTTASVPGILIDRPGAGDRGVVAPVTGVVGRIHRVAGDAVQPGDALFTLKLLSESVYLTQTELFKAAQDIKIAQAQRDRLAASAGAVPEARVVEAGNQVTRSEVAVRAYRQELLTRGLSVAQIDGVAAGTFATEIPVLAPGRPAAPAPPAGPRQVAAAGEPPVGFEVEEVRVELGQQVTAGQTLCLLANHQVLAVEGRAFRDESPLLERSVREGWPVAVDFGEADAGDWPAVDQPLRVTYLANTVDPDTRTFRFLVPLENQSRVVERDGAAQRLWRFRPGQRVRLAVRAEKLDGVFVLPAESVARDGADAYVFRQSGDTFDRKPVRVVYQDRTHAVVADDGSVPPGVSVAQTGAAQLNRIVKSRAGAAAGGVHVHADGSVHGKH